MATHQTIPPSSSTPLLDNPEEYVGPLGIDFETAVIAAIKRIKTAQNRVDQSRLRAWLALCPSWLVLDSTTAKAPPDGIVKWQRGLYNLVYLMRALDGLNELEWETMDAASRSLAECWSIASCWNGMTSAQDSVQVAAATLKALMDTDDPIRYKGRAVYPVEDG